MKTIVEMLDRQTAQLTRLVNDLLDVSRISSGRIEVTRERIDLRAVVRHAVETLVPGLERRSHRLTSDLPQHPVEIVGDHARLSQVVSNLLDNAVKFTPDGGEIGVRLRAQGAQAVLTVRDNGSGIPAELQPHIFTAFAVSEAHPRTAAQAAWDWGCRSPRPSPSCTAVRSKRAAQARGGQRIHPAASARARRPAGHGAQACRAGHGLARPACSLSWTTTSMRPPP